MAKAKEKRVSVKPKTKKESITLLTEEDLKGLKAGRLLAAEPDDCKTTADSDAHSCNPG